MVIIEHKTTGARQQLTDQQFEDVKNNLQYFNIIEEDKKPTGKKIESTESLEDKLKKAPKK